jgi:hypothetical protein
MSDTAGTPGDGTKKEDGLGSEGTIPNEPGSVGVGAGEPTTFEPEEDPDAAAQRDPDAPAAAPDGPDAAEAPDAQPDGGLGAGPRPSDRTGESGTTQPSPDAARDRERDVDASS